MTQNILLGDEGNDRWRKIFISRFSSRFQNRCIHQPLIKSGSAAHIILLRVILHFFCEIASRYICGSGIQADGTLSAAVLNNFFHMYLF